MGMTPLEEIAQKQNMTEAEISAFLAPFGVDLVSEGKVNAHPLRLTRVRFSGTKQSADETGPFEFDRTFAGKCTAIASDQNLTGKTSVIAIAKWALRGEPDSDVSKNVREWLETVVVEGTVDNLPFTIEFDPRRSTGQLVIGVPPAAATSEFSTQAEFAETMESFFSARLELPEIPSFTNNKPGGTEVTHGWKAYLGTIWISDAKDDLLLGETTFASLPSRLLNMFVAVPFAEASYALGQAVSSTEATAKLLAIDHGAEARAERAVQIEAEIELLQASADAAPDPVASSGAVKTTTNRWRTSGDRVDDVMRRLAAVTEEHNAAAGELQLLKRDAAAGRVLSALEPSRCPRCATPVNRTDEADADHCYVCTHAEPADPDEADDPIAPLSEEVAALASTMERLREELASAQQGLAVDAEAMASAHSTLQDLSDGGLSDLVDIARLEGELSSITQDYGNRAEADDVEQQLTLLKAIRKVVETARKDRAIERFAEIDSVLLSLLKKLGFRDAEAAHLLANGGLEITYANEVVSAFKDLQDGEKARARLATVIAMLSVGGGRHPGLIVYDSLADKEMNDIDLGQLLVALKGMADDHEVQVIVTHKGFGVAVEALGAESVVGPSSGAGHIF
jgi:hypothetical protein